MVEQQKENDNGSMDENELMKLLAEDQAKPKKWSLFGRKKSEPQAQKVVEVKTIADIPPIKTVRRYTSENDMVRAAIEGKSFAENDIKRSFSVNFNPNYTTLYNIYRVFKERDSEITNDILVDRETFILQTATIKPGNTQNDENLLGALRKLAMYIFDVYDRARFAKDVNLTGDEIVKKLTDIYNYLDVKELYYPDSRNKR
ncbi:hypothetical protein ACNF42_01625 [Cuniculiplasma sp. SKW3]|uniref:hypothetical protein n=1 Tax=Cuniculiplasma sp. SKW3 TaxID=3400170 RepID=UPI003FCEE6A8